MSNSHAHQPLWALLSDASLRKECHDHRTGPCDLINIDDFIAAAKAGKTSRLRCRYEVVAELRFKSCGCRTCTAHDIRREDRRRSRHESHTDLKRVQKNGLEE